MLFEELEMTKDRELKFVDSFARMYTKCDKLDNKPTVYEREFDFREVDKDILKKYGIEQKRYIYIGSHIANTMNVRSSVQWHRSKAEKDELWELYLKYIEFCKGEINPKLTDEDIKYDFFYTHICFFYVGSLEQARELETQLYNKLILASLFDDSLELLIDNKFNDSSVEIKRESNKITLSLNKPLNGSGVQEIKEVFKLDTRADISELSEEQLYQLSWESIGSTMGELEVTKDNFVDLFKKLIKIKKNSTNKAK